MNSKKIIKFLKQQHPRGYRKRELFATFNLPKKDYIKFRKTLKGLISRGEIIKGGGGRLTIPDENSMFTGILSISKIKNGYIPHENFGNVDLTQTQNDYLTRLLSSNTGATGQGYIGLHRLY